MSVGPSTITQPIVCQPTICLSTIGQSTIRQSTIRHYIAQLAKVMFHQFFGALKNNVTFSKVSTTHRCGIPMYGVVAFLIQLYSTPCKPRCQLLESSGMVSFQWYNWQAIIMGSRPCWELESKLNAERWSFQNSCKRVR